MADSITPLDTLKTRVKEFTIQRNWEQFHSPKEICNALTIEAAELLQLFLWSNGPSSTQKLEQKREAVEDEAADVLYWLLQLSWQHNIDLSKALENKMLKNERKYPVELSKGNTRKYTELV